jgi:adenylate cyclase
MNASEGAEPDEIVEVLRTFGVPEEAIERAVARGDALGAFFETLPLRGDAGRTVTATDIEAAGGMPADKVKQIAHAFGFPGSAREEPAFTPQEAEMLNELWRLRDVWPFELSVQIGRVYGRLLARIANASVQQWFSVVAPRLQAAAPEEGERARTAAETFERLLPVADALLIGVHRRWIEREAAQIAVRTAERGRGDGALSGSVEVSILFCDLKDFTAFADRQGDAAAVQIIDRFAAVVTRENGPEARLTKLLGDGFMCAYPDPELAVQAGARIIAAMRAPDQPGVHASVHHGLAIPREGDYFGSAVNLTARLLGAADRDELVATREVVERCRDLEWVPAGTVHVRGVTGNVEVFKLRDGR